MLVVRDKGVEVKSLKGVLDWEDSRESVILFLCEITDFRYLSNNLLNFSRFRVSFYLTTAGTLLN